MKPQWKAEGDVRIINYGRLTVLFMSPDYLWVYNCRYPAYVDVVRII